MEVVSFVFILLILFQVKHFLADYPLQNNFMLGKFKPGWDFILPLVAHSGVHALFTLVICLFIAPHFWYLALVDFVVHFVMDRIKAGPKYLGRFKALSANELIEIAKDRDIFNPPSVNPGDAGTSRDPRIAYHRERFDTWHKQEKQIKHNTYFWWALGLDQMVHHVTHYYIIFALTMNYLLAC
jgi:hypothetical protein